MNTVPRDLADLLSPQHKSIWEPKFREYLAKLDGRSRTQKPWRINLYECMLLCRDILVLQDKEVNARKKGPRYSARSPVHSPSAGLQNICNERDANFAKLREVYFNEDADEKVGLTNISVSRELSTYRRSCKAWNDYKTSNQKTSKKCLTSPSLKLTAQGTAYRCSKVECEDHSAIRAAPLQF